MLLRSLAVCAVGAFLGSMVEAGVLRVELASDSAPEKPTTATVTLTALDGKDQERIRFSMDMPGYFEVDIELEEDSGIGAWRLSSRVPGYWAPDRHIAFSGKDQTVSVELLPTGLLQGSSSTLAKGTVSRAIDVRFESSPRPDGSVGDVPRTEIVCPLAGNDFRCEVPVGKLDLRLRLGRSVPEYFWGIEVRRGKIYSLGQISAKPRASISGLVETLDGSPLPETVEVVLSRRGATGRHPAQSRRLRALDLKTGANERGFFQFGAIPAGFYSLSATAPGYVSVPTSVEARDDLEAVLIEAVGLDRPSELDVYLDPPQPPFGGHWVVRLARSVEGSGRFNEITVEDISEEGTWSVSLTPGTYSLVIEDQPLDGAIRASRWASQQVDVPRGQKVVTFTIPLVAVKGTLHRGDEPIRGTLWFGGRSSERSIRMDADMEGKFQGVLPEAGRWPIDFQSEFEGGYHFPLAAVQIPERVDGGWAEIEVAVPDTSLHGLVVDQHGNAVDQAIVSARVLDPEFRSEAAVHSNEIGEFHFQGIPPGSVAVQAQAYDAESDWLTLPVTEGVETPPVELQVLERRYVKGIVTSQGQPVPGAQVWYLPGSLAAGSVGSAGFEVASASGQFEFALPASVDSVTMAIMAPGYGLSLRAFQIIDDGSLVVEVQRTSGDLVLSVGSSGPGALLVHGDAAVPLGLLSQWQRIHGNVGSFGAESIRIPSVQPGYYSLCANVAALRSSASDCNGENLAPYGEAHIQLEEL